MKLYDEDPRDIEERRRGVDRMNRLARKRIEREARWESFRRRVKANLGLAVAFAFLVVVTALFVAACCGAF